MRHLDKKLLQPVISNIEKLLANLHVQYHNLRHFHWNVTGRNFIELHTHFEELYKDIEAFIDETAERLRSLDVYPQKTLQEYAVLAEVQEQVHLRDAWQMVEAIRQGSEVIASNLEDILKAAETAEDFGSGDMYATRLVELEKQSWMIKSLLQQ